MFAARLGDFTLLGGEAANRETLLATTRSARASTTPCQERGLRLFAFGIKRSIGCLNFFQALTWIGDWARHCEVITLSLDDDGVAAGRKREIGLLALKHHHLGVSRKWRNPKRMRDIPHGPGFADWSNR